MTDPLNPTLTAADFADTGQWRLIIRLMPDALEASLQNTLHPHLEPQILCSARWLPGYASFCKNLEQTVYDHPRLLDDFATRIIIYEKCTLFIPKTIAEESAGAEEEMFSKVYKAETRDIMTDSFGELTAVWKVAPGVKSFLMRTFPGARITCHLMELIRKASSGKHTDDSCRDLKSMTFLEEIRDGEIDLVLMKDGKLLSASTHDFTKPEDIDRLKRNLLEVYENY